MTEILSFPEHPNFVAVLYTRETAPHAVVLDALRHRSYMRSYSLDDYKERFDAHNADLSNEKARPWPCASCHWNDSEVRKARETKRKRLMEFARTRKLPAGWMKPTPGPKFGGARMSDEEASRIVLPRFHKWSIEDLKCGGFEIEGDPVSRYLEAMGETSEKDEETGRALWSCGCREGEPCLKHRGALNGRDEETGEYL